MRRRVVGLAAMTGDERGDAGDALSPRDGPRSAGFAIHALAGLCILLVVVELGWVPFFEYAWGPSLWRYLSSTHAYALAALVLLLCIPAVRTALLIGLARIPTSSRLGAVLLFSLPLALFALRERLAFGDSRIFYFSMNTNPATFFFPDIGATFFLQVGYRVGHQTGIGGLEVVQAIICLMAPLTVYTFYRAALYLADGTGQALGVLGLVLGTGLVRVFAGHLEVYSFVLAATGAYLWAALAYLRGHCSWLVLALAFGAGVWVHIQYLFLIPSIMLLFVLREPGRGVGHYMKRWIPAGLVSLAPTVAFFVLLAAFGYGQDLQEAALKMVRWSDLGPTPEGHEAWIRLWGGSGAGTRYVIFGRGQLKYLANAFFLLAPFTLLVLTTFVVTKPRRFIGSDEARFLSSAFVPMVLYSVIVRPVYGPYDWDLFSLTAAVGSALAGHLLARETSRSSFTHLTTLAIGAALLLVALPLLVVGIAPSHDAGPFSQDLAKPVHGEPFEESFERRVAPWL